MLRHASQLLRDGVHVKVVSERLGHSTVSITLDVYAHTIPNMQADAAARIDAALAGVGSNRIAETGCVGSNHER